MEGLGHIKGIVAEVGSLKWDGADFTHKVGAKGYYGTVKVHLPDCGDFVTDWLPVAQSLTQDANSYSVPRVGTQVIVLPGHGILRYPHQVQVNPKHTMASMAILTHSLTLIT